MLYFSRCSCQLIVDLSYRLLFAVLGTIRSAVGSAQLLISQKFEQFRGLCNENLVSVSVVWPYPRPSFSCPTYTDTVFPLVKSILRERGDRDRENHSNNNNNNNYNRNMTNHYSSSSGQKWLIAAAAAAVGVKLDRRDNRRSTAEGLLRDKKALRGRCQVSNMQERKGGGAQCIIGRTGLPRLQV